MDILKYRVWDNHNKCYIEECHLLPDGRLFFFIDDGCGGVWIAGNDTRFKVEHCLGHKDKNGKLIYEGDISQYLVCGELYKGIIKYGEYTASLGFGYTSFWRAISYALGIHCNINDDHTAHKITKHLRSVYTNMSVGYYFKSGRYEFGLTESNVKEMEIIGNIHENPELLENQK